MIRAVVFREGPPSVPAPLAFPAEQEPAVAKVEAGAQAHPMAAEALAAQATFEAHMKTLYNNPFASQLLAASSKMFTSFDVNPFLQTTFKQVGLV